jgi:undecaprenyl-phosphate galactose phosphotransferase/putative colanic acid biosynthesis UDP-glucose lipid carrier transferase
LLTVERAALGGVGEAGIKSGTISGRRVVVVGEASELERLPSSDMHHFGLAEIARVGVLQADASKGLSERGRAQVGRAITLSRDLRAAEFVLLLPWNQERLIAEISTLLRSSPLAVKLLPDFAIRSIVDFRRQGGFNPGLTVEIQREPLSRWNRLSKRAIDLSLSFSAMALLSPFLFTIAVAIKLDSNGPVLFRQRRVGFDNREFVIFKFRTMTALDDGAAIEQARRNDSRVTRIGRLLRRSSIDELPQLLNVIRGDMSLVGPRPHAVAHNDQYGSLIASYAFRHHVRPGLTGMAQVQGFRGETSHIAQMERRVEQDLWYINHWSLALDFLIIARTCVVLLKQDAY